jgi:hypothetical protein
MSLLPLPRRRRGLSAGILLLAFLIPVPQTAVSPWTAQIVDESGAPQSNLPVREVWQHYSLESERHQETLTTDARGMVSFPRRILWRPYIVNIVHAVRREPNSGSAAFLLAERPGQQGFADYCLNCAEPAPRRIVLHATVVSR